MSIIEKAAAKFDKKLSSDDSSIIEKATKTREDREETTVVDKIAPEDKSSKILPKEQYDPFPSQYSLLN